MFRSFGREFFIVLLFFLCCLNGERFFIFVMFKENFVIVIKYVFYCMCFLNILSKIFFNFKFYI